MPLIVLTGGPGAGKTTLLAELAARGYTTVPESARALIAERRAAGLPPRPDPLDFAREILRRDEEAWGRVSGETGPVFFDRGPIDALGLLHEAGDLPGEELEARVAGYRMERTVYFLPPWREIHTTDGERDQDFTRAVAIAASIRDWYHRCGFTLVEVPCLPPAERADWLLARVQGTGPAGGAAPEPNRWITTGRPMEEQLAHYRRKLEYEIDSWDLAQALERGDRVQVIDARSPEAHGREHIPGARNLPHRTMDEGTTAGLDRDALLVCYCDGIGCNASTKGALRLTELGFRVKELIGGLDWWKRDGFPTAGTAAGPDAGGPACGCE